MLQSKLQPFFDRYDELTELLSAPDIASDIKKMTSPRTPSVPNNFIYDSYLSILTNKGEAIHPLLSYLS